MYIYMLSVLLSNPCSYSLEMFQLNFNNGNIKNGFGVEDEHDWVSLRRASSALYPHINLFQAKQVEITKCTWIY